MIIPYDVDTEVHDALHPFHYSPVNVNVIADVEGDVVVLTPQYQVSDLLPIGWLIVVSDQAKHYRLVSKLNNGVGGEYRRGLSTHSRGVLVLRVQRGGFVVAYPHHLGAARQEVQDPVADGGVQSQGPELSDELGGHCGVER
jgi:hypothetical protein